MRRFDPVELTYTADWKQFVEMVKDLHMIDLSRRVKDKWDLVQGDSLLFEDDDTIEYFITEIGFRNYFPVVVKVKYREEYSDYEILGYAVGW